MNIISGSKKESDWQCTYTPPYTLEYVTEHVNGDKSMPSLVECIGISIAKVRWGGAQVDIVGSWLKMTRYFLMEAMHFECEEDNGDLEEKSQIHGAHLDRRGA